MNRAQKFASLFFLIVMFFVLIQWIISLAMFSYAVKASKAAKDSDVDKTQSPVARALFRSIASCAFYQFFLGVFYQIVAALLFRGITHGDQAKADTRADTLALLSFWVGVAIVASGTLMNNTNLDGVQAALAKSNIWQEGSKPSKLLVGIFGYSIWILILLWIFTIVVLIMKRTIARYNSSSSYQGNVQMPYQDSNQYGSGYGNSGGYGSGGNNAAGNNNNQYSANI